MPRADLEIHPDALLEAEAGVLWYLERSGGAAEHFFANLERALEIIVEAPDAEGPYGAKEAGEGPLNPVPPAIANAVYDAIGIRFDATPITADKILRAISQRDRTTPGAGQ